MVVLGGCFCKATSTSFQSLAHLSSDINITATVIQTHGLIESFNSRGLGMTARE